ncbi:hypothetical protein SAMN06265376_104229 [Dokdonia pacifica]|uniref:Uncharacterized protein n=1 Tax=Dokdonia pacifica TaxID=1627892 RepID=A0A239AA43_9FLAO|nr:hypothetical protein SAMN06265376_104229 [Dokdonia pacifica]
MLEQFKTYEIQNPQLIYGGEIKTKVDPDPYLE